MFEQGHNYILLTKRIERDEYPLIRRIIYRFSNSTGKKYLVPIHEYDYKVYALKFHLWEHKNNSNRYNLVINDFDCSKTMRTILNIAMEILGNDPMASFAFVGVHKIDKEIKDTENNQRFRIYKRITEYFFGDITFLHGYSEKSNCYLLVNKSNTDPAVMYETIVQMFANHFQDIGDI